MVRFVLEEVNLITPSHRFCLSLDIFSSYPNRNLRHKYARIEQDISITSSSTSCASPFELAFALSLPHFFLCCSHGGRNIQVVQGFLRACGLFRSHTFVRTCLLQESTSTRVLSAIFGECFHSLKAARILASARKTAVAYPLISIPVRKCQTRRQSAT